MRPYWQLSYSSGYLSIQHPCQNICKQKGWTSSRPMQWLWQHRTVWCQETSSQLRQLQMDLLHGQTRGSRNRTKTQRSQWRLHCHRRGEERWKTCLERWLLMKQCLMLREHMRYMCMIRSWIQQLRSSTGGFSLYNDLAILDSRNFPEIRTNGLPQSALQELNKCLLKFNNKATVDNLQCELKNLTRQWDRLKASPLEEYLSRTVGDTSDENDEEEVEILHKSCNSCKNYLLCCYQIPSQFNLLTDAYHLIGLG